VYKTKPENVGFVRHLFKFKDPFILTVILEDFAATLVTSFFLWFILEDLQTQQGIVVCASGILMSEYTANPLYDGIASITVGCMLAVVAGLLVRTNKMYLLGKSIDEPMETKINKLLEGRESVEKVFNVKSRWEGPETFGELFWFCLF